MSGYDPVEARREWEMGMIRERLAQGQEVDTAVCHVERVSSDPSTLRFGLKRGKLLYLFRYPTHDVEREKHRNVIARARYIKNNLEQEGYRLVPWDFKKGRPPTFWNDESTSMEGTNIEDDEDDLYGPSETTTTQQNVAQASNSDDEEKGDEPMDEGLESGEEEEEDDSDVEFVLDKPQISAPKPTVQPVSEPGSKAVKIEQPPQQQTQTLATRTASGSAVPGLAPTPQQIGTNYPAVRNSNIDVNQDPVYPPVGKPVSQIDIDADLAEHNKPWRLPGADQSDYFNYGFDEFTWEMYRQKQAAMSQTLQAQKAETAQFQQMFGGLGAGMPGGPSTATSGPPTAGVPGAPTGPSAQQQAPQGAPDMAAMAMSMGLPPGGPTPDQMMAYMQQMQAQGISPENMDFGQFMSAFAGAQGGGFGPGGQGGFPGGPGGGGQFGGPGGGQRGGRRGRGW